MEPHSETNHMEEAGGGAAGVDMCSLDINIKQEVITSIVCSLCLSFGLIYCFLGYRCFKLVMFLSGLMLGTTAALLLYQLEPALNVRLSAESKAGAGLGVGVLCGLMTLLVSTMGLVFSGLQLGTLFSLLPLVAVGQFHSLTPAWAPLAAVAVVSVVTAAVTVTWQKLFGIVYTSVLGAFTVMLCVDHLLGAFALPDQVYDMLSQTAPPPLCWYNWAIMAICPLLSSAGVLVQWRVTAKGLSHTDDYYKKQRKHSMRLSYRDSRGRPYSQRRRRPPPLKRYAGDVLAPSYLQTLQERHVGTGSSCSSSSVSSSITHHALIDFDFETGSMVPLTAAVYPPSTV